MSAATALPGDTPPLAGGAVPGGRRVLVLVERMRRTGMALAACINRIARQRLEGQDIRRMAPPGFSATATHALVVQAVAWTLALRERLLALYAVRPALAVAASAPRTERAPRGHGADHYLPNELPNPTEDDWHDWWDLAKPLRIGPGGVAVATRQIAGKSSQQVVADVNANLSTALAQLGSAADVTVIGAVAAEAQALLRAAEAAEETAAAADEAAEDAAAKDAVADPPREEPAGEADAAPVAPAGGPPPQEPETAAPSDAPGTEADVEPPPKPPD
jgi:hypothetical protein